MKGLLNKLLLSLGVFVAAGVIYAHAQTEGFIYGTVITEDGDKYTGPLRWEKKKCTGLICSTPPKGRMKIWTIYLTMTWMI